MVVIVILRIGLPYLKPDSDRKNISFSQIQIQNPEHKHIQKYKKEKYKTNKPVAHIVDTTIKFDPNTASFATLLKVGFSEFAANNLLKFCDRGGKIYAHNDLIKIYGVDSVFLTKINRQIVIATQIDESKKYIKKLFTIEINNADADTLQSIPCIGPVISKRIIKYRTQLGGFVSLHQLVEVYGVDSSCYKNILQYLILDVELIQKLNLNTVDEKIFNQHPYISKYQARAIVKYRELMGSFTRISQLKENHIFTKSELYRLVDYLSLSDE